MTCNHKTKTNSQEKLESTSVLSYNVNKMYIFGECCKKKKKVLTGKCIAFSAYPKGEEKSKRFTTVQFTYVTF